MSRISSLFMVVVIIFFVLVLAFVDLCACVRLSSVASLIEAYFYQRRFDDLLFNNSVFSSVQVVA